MAATKASSKGFKGGYPAATTVQRAYDEADLNRAIQAYRFFYPTVSIVGTWKGNLKGGVVPNKVFALLEGTPNQLVFTPNSDTPYAGVALDLNIGPIVVEFPPGKGGKHLLLPPGWSGAVPADYYVGRPTTNRVLMLLRAMPTPGGQSPNELMQTVKVYPLDRGTAWQEPKWLQLKRGDFTPLKWEDNLQYWKELHELIDTEPHYEGYRSLYGELAELGIAKGQRFAPNARMKGILTKAAQIGNGIMRVQSFADRRPERIVWKDRKWEWAVLRPDNGTFDTEHYTDLYAREKWFFQAQIESPAMFSRAPGAGSLYWLGVRDKSGAYLDGAQPYKLVVPQPVPAKLFWSVTVYDALTRSEIATKQKSAALRSMFELKGLDKETTVTLHFGPKLPKGVPQSQWIQTIPGHGWFAYFRIYGPEQPAFDGSWRPEDFKKLG